MLSLAASLAVGTAVSYVLMQPVKLKPAQEQGHD
jgi:hypothetical protein